MHIIYAARFRMNDISAGKEKTANFITLLPGTQAVFQFSYSKVKGSIEMALLRCLSEK